MPGQWGSLDEPLCRTLYICMILYVGKLTHRTNAEFDQWPQSRPSKSPSGGVAVRRDGGFAARSRTGASPVQTEPLRAGTSDRARLFSASGRRVADNGIRKWVVDRGRDGWPGGHGRSADFP